MKRREPPPAATWMLTHLGSGHRNDALYGDLLEEFKAGRSEGWYWRQVLAACGISWFSALSMRIPLALFALLWSMFAPAWKVVSDEVLSNAFFDRIANFFGFIWILPALVTWTAFQALFLWAGIFAFVATLYVLGNTFSRAPLRRAVLVAPVILTAVSGCCFVLTNLYWWTIPGLAHTTLPGTWTGRITNLNLLSDIFRFPYFCALLGALWTVVPYPRRSRKSLHTGLDTSFSDLEWSTPQAALETFALRRVFAFMLGAGLVNSLITGYILCRLSDTTSTNFVSLFSRALCYVLLCTVAGIVGTWLYWKSPSSPFADMSSLPFPLFAIVCASGWVWVPSFVLFSDQFSAGAPLVAMMAAFFLAAGLRSATGIVLAPVGGGPALSSTEEGELFAESLQRPPLEIGGYAIAFSIYLAVAALFKHWNFAAALLLAFSGFLFSWKRTVPRTLSINYHLETRKAKARLILVIAPAVLVTAWALLNGVGHRNARFGAAIGDALGKGTATRPAERPDAHPAVATGPGAYQSVILWPFPEKTKIVAPVEPRDPHLDLRTRQPLVLRFRGSYWYLQPPDSRPGPNAHRAQGSPLAVHIAASNDDPVVMEAHQDLAAPVRLSRCREIQVDIDNFDNRPGSIALAVVLGDATAPGKPTLYLGQQSLATTEPANFVVKTSPISESVRFAIPDSTKIREFSEITVLLLPDIEHTFVAPRIAIEQFQIFPR